MGDDHIPRWHDNGDRTGRLAAMTKRRLDDEAVRELVIARRAKGWAFMRDGKAWRDQVTREVEGKGRKELFETYADYLHDVKA